MNNIILPVLILYLLFPACVQHKQTSSAQKNAVPIESNEKFPSQLAIISISSTNFSMQKAENIALEILQKKGFVVISRSDTDKILKEQHIQNNQLIMDKNNAARLGQLMGAKAIMILEPTNIEFGQLNNGDKYLKQLNLTGRLIDIEKGKLLWIKNIESNSIPPIGEIALLPFTILTGYKQDVLSNGINKLLEDFPLASLP